jgi:ABC-3C protein
MQSLMVEWVLIMNYRLKPANSSASGQYLGFALQPVRACFRLLSEPPSSKVSLEYADDVAVHYDDETILLEQDKSALTGNPLSNGAKDLWKTIKNWSEYVEGHGLGFSDCRYVLYVTPQRGSEFANLLNECSNKASLKEIDTKLADYLRDHSPRGYARSGIKMLQGLSFETRMEFLKNISIVSEEEPLDALKSRLSVAVDPTLIEEATKAIIGLAKEDFDFLVRQGQDPVISAAAFQAKAYDFLGRFNLRNMWPRLHPEPSTEDLAVELARRPVFIRQLELVDAGDPFKNFAVNDFLRTSGDKSAWAAKGIINEELLNEWDTDLLRRFQMVSGETEALHADKTPAQRGLAICSQCGSFQTKMDSREVPDYFVNGSYHALADQKTIGWHPNFETLLDDTQ